jgi:hypothetical protein
VNAKPRTAKIRIGRYWSTVARFYHATPFAGTSATLVRGPGSGPTMPS